MSILHVQRYLSVLIATLCVHNYYFKHLDPFEEEKTNLSLRGCNFHINN